MSSDVIWVGEGNIPEYKDKHILIGVSISGSSNGTSVVPHEWGVYGVIDYVKQEMEYPHLVFDFAPRYWPLILAFDVSENFIAILMVCNFHIWLKSDSG